MTKESPGTMVFQDHFSKQSGFYAKFRPGYPKELFSYLAGLAGNHDLAIDCATGNGQAALGLVRYFKKIIAVDPSRAQLRHAVPHPQIEYVQDAAENLTFPKQSVDLISVASGLHWFDSEKFYARAKEILKPAGILAAWTYYGWSSRSGVDELIFNFEQNVVGDYWPNPFQKSTQSHYLGLAFPFDEIQAPNFELPVRVNKEQVVGYLRTWSATQRYIEKNSVDPTDRLKDDLNRLFARSSTLDLTFRVVMRVGRSRCLKC